MEQQKTAILEKAEAQFLRYGIRSVTMDDLAREMGISKKTLYQYVDNKADLIGQIIVNHVETERRCINDMAGEATNAIAEMLQIGKHAIQQLRKISPAVVYDLKKYYRNSWEMLEALYSQHVYQVIVENIQRGAVEGNYRKNIDADIIAKLYVGKTFQLVDEAVFPLKEYRRDKLFSEFIKYHLYGITTVAGRTILKNHL